MADQTEILPRGCSVGGNPSTSGSLRQLTLSQLEHLRATYVILSIPHDIIIIITKYLALNLNQGSETTLETSV